MATFTVHQVQNKHDCPARIRFDDNYQAGDFDHYTPVYRVEADDLNHVFALTNHWGDRERVLRLDRGHSTSVGDIIETGQVFLFDCSVKAYPLPYYAQGFHTVGEGVAAEDGCRGYGHGDWCGV